jgi:predicted kinase
MEMLLFIGIQATGKSTFYKERFFRTHLRVNYDMLRTRHREDLLFAAGLESKTKLVIDNTNLTRADRARYIAPAREARYSIIGYFFQSRVQEALARNSRRDDSERVPDAGVHGASGKLELPSLGEGFDRLFFVRIDESQGFVVEDWQE